MRWLARLGTRRRASTPDQSDRESRRDQCEWNQDETKSSLGNHVFRPDRQVPGHVDAPIEDPTRHALKHASCPVGGLGICSVVEQQAERTGDTADRREGDR